MRRAKPHKLWLIVLALAIVPPLGLLMLWRSPRNRTAKIVISAICVLLIAGAVVGAVRTHDRWAAKNIPECGYDVTMNSRNRYRNPQVLPLEREIFSAVVREMRYRDFTTPMDAFNATGPNVAESQTRAFAIVAKRHDMDPEAVAAIYRKVSSRLTPGRK